MGKRHVYFGVPALEVVIKLSPPAPAVNPTKVVPHEEGVDHRAFALHQ